MERARSGPTPRFDADALRVTRRQPFVWANAPLGVEGGADRESPMGPAPECRRHGHLRRACNFFAVLVEPRDQARPGTSDAASLAAAQRGSGAPWRMSESRRELSAADCAVFSDRERDPGEVGRFHETILPHLDRAYGFALCMSRDADVAEDIVQEAFLRAFRAFPEFRGGASKAWLFAIVRNCILNAVRARKRHAAVLVDDCELSETQSLALAHVADLQQGTPEEDFLRRQEAEALRAAIENLPEPFRGTLILRHIEDLSYREIAVLTAVPIGTVMSRLARARQMLRDTLRLEFFARRLGLC
jgi:RNA polymerase sigma factor (sigma-70 family)